MRRLAVLATMAFLALTGTAAAQDLHATPSTFASVYSSAQGGDTILLASGAYGSWDGGSKTGMVTIDEEPGANATFAGGTFGTSVRNLTIRNITYTSPVCVNPPTNVKMNLIFDGDSWGDLGQSCGEGRLSIRNGGTSSIDGNGVQVKNSSFGPGGCSDGIQDLSNGTEIGPGNDFHGMTQACGSAEAHVDSVQPYGSNFIHIHDNYFHGNEQGIMSPDGVSTGYLIENNVIDMAQTQYYCMHMGDTRNGTIRHNVCINGGGIRVYGGNQNVNSQNMTIQNNASPVDNGGCTGCTIDHNQTVTFVGGSGRCAYATQSPKGTGSDGTDIGLNDCGGTPPADADGDGVPDSADLCPGTPAGTQVDSNGCPFQQPPTDHTPVARFTASPEPSVVGQTVTFDGTASTCEDTPCTYHWHDINGGDWPLGPDGATSTIAFQSQHNAANGGPVQAELVLTDADGDVATVEHDHTVNASGPPPDTTPPDTTITSAPTDSQSTSASVSFTGTVGDVDHFDCQLDGGAYATCTSPKSYTGLAVGSHTVNVKAVDAAGNADPTPATATWTVQAPPTSGPPVFKAEYESAWNTTANKTVSVPVVPGDVLVAYAGSQDSPNALSISGTGLTWGAAKLANNARASAYVWTATATTTTTATVTVSDSATSWHFGVDVLKFGNSTGIGATNQSATQSVSLTTTKDNSAIVKFVTDWNAGSGASRNSLTTGVGAFTETSYFLDAGQYTVYGGYHANVGAIGVKTVGYSAPTGMSANTEAIEVKGT